jgi:HEPN domain-containing protein
MKNQISENLFVRAEDMLNHAEEELQRAEGDVVVPAVCFHTRKTICNYLEGYLIRHMHAPQEPVSLKSLLNQCVSINPEFKKIDLSSFECKHDKEVEPAAYCLSVSKVKSCYNIAQEVKALIMRSEM